MLILHDRGHIRWIAGVALAGVVGYGAYRASGGGDRVEWTGGRLPGLALGIAAAVLMLFAELLWAVRHRKEKWWLFRRQTWLRGHIWLGVLGVWLAVLHGGFRFGGPVEQWTWVFLGVTVATGLAGLVLQHALPRAITGLLPEEVPFNQVARVRGTLRHKADVAVESVCGRGPLDRQMAALGTQEAHDGAGLAVEERFARLYLREVRPYLAAEAPSVVRRRRARRDELADSDRATAYFEQLHALPLPQSMKAEVGTLEACCRVRRELDRLDVRHWWLRAWIAVHVAASLVFWGFVVIHIGFALYY